MVAATSDPRTSARAAQMAALAGPSASVNRTGQTLRLKHPCLATACADLSCKLCANSALRACGTVLKQKYVAGSALQAPCGAWPVVQLLNPKETEKEKSSIEAKFELKVELIDEVKYQQLDPAGTAPTAEQVTGCLASDAGLKYKGSQGAIVTLAVKDGVANLDGLHIYKVPGGRSGHSTFYRLLFTVLATNPNTPSTTAAASADSCAGATPAATLLTDKLQLVTTRSRSNEKSCVLHGHEPVKRVLAVGDGFAKILGSLKAHVSEVPNSLASVSKVKEFHQLVEWVKATSNTSVPSLFRPNDWARASQHVLSALYEEDTRQRLWFPSVNGAGLLFTCQKGDPKLDSPAGFVLMLDGRLVVRAISQLGALQLQQLMQKAIADWTSAGHPNWSVYDENATTTSPVTATVAEVSKISAVGKPTAVLARAAIAAAFGGMIANSKPAGAAHSSRKVRAASRQQAAAPVAAAGAPAAVTFTATNGPEARSSAESTGAAAQPSASAAIEAPKAVSPFAVVAEAAKSTVTTAASVSKRQQEQQADEPDKQPPKKLCTAAATKDFKETASLAAAVCQTATDAPLVGPELQLANMSLDINWQQQQPGVVEQQLLAAHSKQDSVFGGWCVDLDALDHSDDLGSCSSFWQELEEQQQQRMLSEEPEEVDDLQQLMLMNEEQDEATDLRMVYEFMCKEWCSEFDAELGNNLGSSFLCELQQMQMGLESDAQHTQQQQKQQEKKVSECKNAVGPAVASVCELQTTISRLLSLSDLPVDVVELCGTSVATWSQALDELPAVML